MHVIVLILLSYLIKYNLAHNWKLGPHILNNIIWIEYLSSSYLNSKGMMKFERYKATVCVSSETKFVKIAISNNLQIIFDNNKSRWVRKVYFLLKCEVIFQKKTHFRRTIFSKIENKICIRQLRKWVSKWMTLNKTIKTTH